MTKRSHRLFSTLFPMTLLVGLSGAGCAVQTAQDDAASREPTATAEEAMCMLPALWPSVVGTLGLPPKESIGLGPGAPVYGTSPANYQTSNCSGSYEIEAWMPANEPAPIAQEQVVFEVHTPELDARPDCTSVLHMSFTVQGLANGTWVPVTSGTGSIWAATNACNIEGFASLPLAQAEAYSGFRLAASAYLKEGKVVTYLPVTLEMQQDPTF